MINKFGGKSDSNNMALNLDKALKVSLFTILCFGSLFLTSSKFVDSYTSPKWYFSIFCCSALIIVLIVEYIAKRGKIYLKNSVVDIRIAFAVIMYTSVCQALFGLLQYVGLFKAYYIYKETGSFDNPAGFAACLCASYPICLYFLLDKNQKLKYSALVSTLTIILAIILSESRTGILCIVVVSGIFLFRQSSIQFKKTRVLFLIVFIMLIGVLYFLKKESADGRLLVWKCSMNMIMERPILGYGSGGFDAKYMLFQANYFASNPNSKFALLADNINRPFNEYLSILINYGFVGFSIFLILILCLLKHYRKCSDKESNFAGLSLLIIGLFSLFSYPFTYPFVWIVCLLCIFFIFYNSKSIIIIMEHFIVRLIIVSCICIITLLCYIYARKMIVEMKWCDIANKSLMGKSTDMLLEYANLRNYLGHNRLFLYNFAAELHEVGHYDESLNVALECEKVFADYDLQLLLADDYLKTKNYYQAEKHYTLASQMCPSRFLPIFHLVKLYEAVEDSTMVLFTAQKIVEKPVKIESSEIDIIKYEMSCIIKKKNKSVENILSNK